MFVDVKRSLKGSDRKCWVQFDFFYIEKQRIADTCKSKVTIRALKCPNFGDNLDYRNEGQLIVTGIGFLSETKITQILSVLQIASCKTQI